MSEDKPKKKNEKHSKSMRKNKNALGYGRPPKIYSDDQIVELGEELIEWVKSDEFKNAVHMCDFYIHKKMIPPKEWECIRQRTCFLPYYEIAKKALAAQIMRNKKLQQSYGNRYLGMYDSSLDEFEEAKRDKESERRINERKAEPEVRLSFSDLVKKEKDGTLLEDISQDKELD